MKVINKAVTFRASSIGDSLMGKYLLENIHAQYPQAKCALIVASRGAMIRDLCAGYPWLQVIETNRKDPKGLLSLWKKFGGSDLAVTQYAGKDGGKFSFGSKIAARILAHRGGMYGFTDASSINAFLYDHLETFEQNTAPAEMERRILKSAGVPIALPYPKLTIVPNKTVLTRIGLVEKNYVVMHFFAGNKSRGLSPLKMREVLIGLAEALPHSTFVITGALADTAAANEAAKGLQNAQVVAGQLSLQETMQLIANSSGVVSVDTGIAHITAQLGVPLVVLASCLGLHWWSDMQYGAGRPINLYTDRSAHPEGHSFVEYPPCLNNIPIQDVLAGAKKMFATYHV